MNEQKYFITGNVLRSHVEVFATSRLEALSRLGLTVWAEAEWQEAQKIQEKLSPLKKL